MGRGSRVWRKYLGTYVLLGVAVLLIAGLVWEGIESGKWLWYRIGIALFMIAIAIANFATLHRRERKRAEPSPAADGGGM
jgi:hypothetical protein